MKHWGIRARVLLLALAPSVMILLTLVVYFTYERMAEVESARAARGVLLARQLAPAVEFAIFAGDQATLQRLADAVARENEVSSVTIANATGEVLARAALGAPAASDLSAPISVPVTRTRLAVDDPAEQSQAPSAPATIGTITVVMSRAATRAQQQRLLLIGLSLGLAGLLLALSLALVIGDSVTRPIRHLAGAMVQLGRGQRVEPLAIAGGGEFRTLGEGFNGMAQRLQADARELEARIVEATRALTVQKDAAEQATNAKSRFIAAASHDLRQPLHAVGLFTATLERRTAGTELQPVVADLSKTVSVMERLLHSLLDISRLDAGTLRAEPRAFPLQRLFAQLAAEFADAAQLKRLHWHVGRTDVVVLSDELLLHRILSNLVANAIRYTASGSVLLCCRRRGNEVRIEVRDSGIGIAPDKHADVFQEFYQIGAAERDGVMGLGLGLAIVARLAQLLGTSVQVASAPGRGSVFSLCLPRSELTAAPFEETTAPSLRREQAESLRVLVVDDDPLVLAGNRALLEELGCQVAAVTDRDSALALLSTLGEGPLLILCDMWLADGRTGIELLREVSTLARANLSTVLISGDTGPETLQAARAAGIPLLHKPVAPAKLRAIVMNFARDAGRSTAPGRRDEDPAR